MAEPNIYMDTQKDKKIKNRTIILFLISAVTICLLVFYVFKNKEAFQRIHQISYVDIAVFAFLQLVLLAVNALVQMVYMQHFNVKVGFLNSFGLNTLHTFFNNIMVKGGILARGYFLKKVHQFNYTHFALMLTSFVIIDLMVGGFLGMLILVWLAMIRGSFSVSLFGVFLLLFLGSLAITCFPISVLPTKKHLWIVRKLNEVIVSWQKIAQDRRALGSLFLLALASFIIYALRLQYGFAILFKPVSFLESLLMSIVGMVANLIGLTPGGLGIREFFVGSAYGLIQGSSVEAVVVIVLDRIVSSVLVFFVGGFFIFYFLKKSSKTHLHES